MKLLDKDGLTYYTGKIKSVLLSYATKSYVDGLVGDINDALDLLNGESV